MDEGLVEGTGLTVKTAREYVPWSLAWEREIRAVGGGERAGGKLSEEREGGRGAGPGNAVGSGRRL